MTMSADQARSSLAARVAERASGELAAMLETFTAYSDVLDRASAILGRGRRPAGAGDEETATAKLGRAVSLAHESGKEDTARLLARVVDVVDPATGTVRLKSKVTDADEMTLDTRSSKTVRVKK